jgi:hypothetical protein
MIQMIYSQFLPVFAPISNKTELCASIAPHHFFIVCD